MSSVTIQFPAIRGVQAEQEFYSIMMKYSDLVKFLSLVDEELPPEERAQRTVSKSRSNLISDYMLMNPKKYVIPALTASISGDFEFVPNESVSDIGILKVAIDAKFLINDGQHRRLGIELAIARDEELGRESANITLFVDQGLKRAQQLFSDINGNAQGVSKSLTITYDNRSKEAAIAKSIAKKVEVFKRYTEMEKGTISNKSTKLFTMKHLYDAINNSFPNTGNYTIDLSACTKYWQCVASSIQEWQDILEKRYYPQDIRQQFICYTALVLVAIGKVGKAICEECGNDADAIAVKLERLKLIDWHRNNPDWQSVCFVEGKLSSRAESRKKMVEYIENFLNDDDDGRLSDDLGCPNPELESGFEQNKSQFVLTDNPQNDCNLDEYEKMKDYYLEESDRAF